MVLSFSVSDSISKSIALSLILLGSACGGSSPSNAPTVKPASAIEHLVVVIQENHTFDNYFGQWCTADVGSNPTCTSGPSCCERGPDTDPGTGDMPTVLDDTANGSYDPNHAQSCEVEEIHDGKMDKFVTAAGCGDPRNFAYADPITVKPLRDLAAKYALADRYFQPVAGASTSNDMYLGSARFVFDDDDFTPNSVGQTCAVGGKVMSFTGTTLADLMTDAKVTWAFYAEGYKTMADSIASDGRCPDAPADCPAGTPIYPCVFDPGDVPFEYYSRFADNPTYMKDYAEFEKIFAAGSSVTLPQVSFVKALGYKTEHPGQKDAISTGIAFTTGLSDKIAASRFADSTLLLIIYDEGGGYFDHVAPPATSTVDMQPYGMRLPVIAAGPFARKSFISHVTMEHSSIVKFVEWNWLGQTTGQLAARDQVVANLGSLLDPTATVVAVPEQ